MELKINSYFNGTINGVDFDNEETFMVTGNILECIEKTKKFKIKDSNITECIKKAVVETYNAGGEISKFEKYCTGNIVKGHSRIFPWSGGPYTELNEKVSKWL